MLKTIVSISKTKEFYAQVTEKIRNDATCIEGI